MRWRLWFRVLMGDIPDSELKAVAVTSFLIALIMLVTLWRMLS